MSDRLTLANAIVDAGIERPQAERIASTIVDLIHDNVATKADIARLEAVTKAEFGVVRGEMALVEHRLTTRLGGLAVALVGIAVTALHYWPPGAHP